MRMSHGVVAALSLVLLASGCSRPKNRPNRDDYPLIFVKHETVEYKLSQLGQRVTGSAVESPMPAVLTNGNPGIVFFVNTGWRMFFVAFDRKTKEWSILLSFIDPTPMRNREETERFRKEDDAVYAIAKEKFTAAADELFDHLVLPKSKYFRGWPETWTTHSEEQGSYDPPEAAYFTFETTGGYKSYHQRVGGGALGWEGSSREKFSYFDGVRSMYYKSKLVFQSVDEQMIDLLTVTDNFKTAIYKHRSVDSIKFSLMDLSELDEDKAVPHVPQTPAQPAGPR